MKEIVSVYVLTSVSPSRDKLSPLCTDHANAGLW